MDNENQYSVIISERAENNLDNIVKYLLADWSEQVKDSFLARLKKTVNLLSIDPYIFQEFSKRKRIRKCLITKHNTMYYRIVGKTVQIITIHDTRMNPQRLIIC
jgi:plasmid stabilization system protein ParE